MFVSKSDAVDPVDDAILPAIAVYAATDAVATVRIDEQLCGNLSLVKRGDKIFPVAQDEMQEMIKNKVFPKSRPKEVKLDNDLKDFLGR